MGWSRKTFECYGRHVAAMALHFGCLPTDLDPDQVQDYLYGLQQRSKTPSQNYFKHTVYGLRLLLKTEGLPYGHLRLPEVSRPKKLPVILSCKEIWSMLSTAQLLKHRLLIGLLYGCGLRCMEVRYIELKHLDPDRKLLLQFGKTGGLQQGMVAVPHTWGQNLGLHPHLHCIVPGGGIDNKGHWQRQVKTDKFLFPVKALSKVFRAKYYTAAMAKRAIGQGVIRASVQQGLGGICQAAIRWPKTGNRISWAIYA